MRPQNDYTMADYAEFLRDESAIRALRAEAERLESALEWAERLLADFPADSYGSGWEAEEAWDAAECERRSAESALARVRAELSRLAA